MFLTCSEDCLSAFQMLHSILYNIYMPFLFVKNSKVDLKLVKNRTFNRHLSCSRQNLDFLLIKWIMFYFEVASLQ